MTKRNNKNSDRNAGQKKTRSVAGEPLRAPSVLNVDAEPMHYSPGLAPKVLTGLLVLFTVFVLLFLAWRGVRTLGSYLYAANDRFELRMENIHIESDNYLKPKVVLDMLGISQGANLMRLSLSGIRDKLESKPFIRRVRLERVLPDQLYIGIEERIEAARIPIENLNRGFVFLVDREGEVIRMAPASRYTKLPLITDLNSPSKKLGKNISRSLAGDVMKLLRLYDRKRYLHHHLPIASVRVNDPEKLHITLKTGQTISPLRTNLEYCLPRFAQVLDQAPARLGAPITHLTHNQMENYFARIQTPERLTQGESP